MKPLNKLERNELQAENLHIEEIEKVLLPVTLQLASRKPACTLSLRWL